jgi:hypothetical protein
MMGCAFLGIMVIFLRPIGSFPAARTAPWIRRAGKRSTATPSTGRSTPPPGPGLVCKACLALSFDRAPCRGVRDWLALTAAVSWYGRRVLVGREERLAGKLRHGYVERRAEGGYSAEKAEFAACMAKTQGEEYVTGTRHLDIRRRVVAGIAAQLHIELVQHRISREDGLPRPCFADAVFHDG